MFSGIFQRVISLVLYEHLIFLPFSDNATYRFPEYSAFHKIYDIKDTVYYEKLEQICEKKNKNTDHVKRNIHKKKNEGNLWLLRELRR